MYTTNSRTHNDMPAWIVHELFEDGVLIADVVIDTTNPDYLKDTQRLVTAMIMEAINKRQATILM